LKAQVILEKLRRRSVFSKSRWLRHGIEFMSIGSRPARGRAEPTLTQRSNAPATLHTKRHRPTPEELRVAYGKSIPDVIAPGLQLLFVGINPSLYSAAVGHHFARPGNRFWPTLHGAGFTDRLLAPVEQNVLLDRGYGITNVVDEATARADQLTRKDLSDGIKRLERRVRRFRPSWVAFLGISTFQAVFDQKSATIGAQQSQFGGARVWLLPNPSGLNAHYQLGSLVRLFGELRAAIVARRKSSIGTASPGSVT
jgi:TDG/mug DNA glycosylase family protein